MKKVLKLLIVFVVMFGFSTTVMAKPDTYKSTCIGMKADDYTCNHNKLQRVYSLEESGRKCDGKDIYNGNNCINWEAGDAVAACYLEYDDKKKTKFKGYFFNIIPRFTDVYPKYYDTSKVNAYYHGPNDNYTLEDGSFGNSYALIWFEDNWKKKFKDKKCPDFANFYIYHWASYGGVSGTARWTTYKGGEIQFGETEKSVHKTDEIDHDTTVEKMLCISKDAYIEDEIDDYLEKIKDNIKEALKDNIDSGNSSDYDSIADAILKENEEDLKEIEEKLKQTINADSKNANNSTLYCESYIESLTKKVHNTNTYKESILDTVYYLAVDNCVGENSTPGKYLSNPENYQWYKRGKSQLGQTSNADYARHLQNYLKGAPEITDNQVSCIANHLGMAEEIAEEEKGSLNNLISSTQSEMQAARAWLDKGFTGPGIDPKDLTCEEMLGKNLTKILKFTLEVLSIVGAIIAIVNSMISLIPALIAKDAEALKKAQSKCITMAIVLVLILLLPTLITFMGKIFGYDLTCFNWMK